MRDMEPATKRWMCSSAAVVLGVSIVVTIPSMRAGVRPLPTLISGGGKAVAPFDGPISFEPNQGQADEQVRFTARGAGYTLLLTNEAAVLSFENGALQSGLESPRSLVVKLVGANPASKLLAKDELPAKSSYFLGSDPKKWRTGIPNYRRVQLENVYPGIDVMYEGTQGRLECHFLVAAAASPNRIIIAISGARDLRLDAGGNLVLRTEQTELRLHRPTAYQNVGGNKRFVSARYLVHKSRINFALSQYDRTIPLVIDPVLSYAEYLTTQDAAANPRQDLTKLAVTTKSVSVNTKVTNSASYAGVRKNATLNVTP
jgi:hypothetical protein